MTEDFIDKSFSDLDEFYPGSKRKRKTPVKKETESIVATWDAKPKTITMPNGTDMEMFGIGALAAALGRPIITIRTWIKEGYIPSAPYRLPTKKTRYGGDRPGNRLYSRAMIETAIELFSKFDVLETKRIDWAQHQDLSKALSDAWVKIRSQETSTN
jgi:hypothetical protein